MAKILGLPKRPSPKIIIWIWALKTTVKAEKRYLILVSKMISKSLILAYSWTSWNEQSPSWLKYSSNRWLKHCDWLVRNLESRVIPPARKAFLAQSPLMVLTQVIAFSSLWQVPRSVLWLGSTSKTQSLILQVSILFSIEFTKWLYFTYCLGNSPQALGWPITAPEQLLSSDLIPDTKQRVIIKVIILVNSLLQQKM